MNGHALIRLIGLALALSTGCSRGADEARLRIDVQERLNRDVKPGLFQVIDLRREGSSPMPAGESGASRVLVYYNATLKLGQDYAFGGWDQLSRSSVAFALGANEKGVYGLESQNRAGDLVRAYGSAVYEQGADGWTAGAAVPSGKQTATAEDLEGTSTRSKQLIDRLAAMVNLPPPGAPPQQDDIIADELARASENIERRVQRRAHTFTIATGQENGDYASFGTSMIAAINELAPNLKLRQRNSEGSIENARLIATGEADYAFVQGDVAAAAFTGEDAFAQDGPRQMLRAVGALFPEPVQIVVLASSPITTVTQLKGKRINLGAPSSGSRFDALAVLGAYGLKTSDFSVAGDDGLVAAIAKLRGGQLDALFTTGLAPTRVLQQLALSPGMRLLSIRGAAIDEIVRTRPGLAPLTLPPNTYPQQKEAVVTVASAALLVTTMDTPDAEVAQVSDLIYKRMPTMRGRSADAVAVSTANELRGVTIPLHPGTGHKVQ